ncbi:MAG: molybdenum cofactor biosynthesis protein MoaE [Verrucomicrobiota bacterium]
MDTHIRIISRQVEKEDLPRLENTGAIVEFSGTVRHEENDQNILGLEYQAYENMAIRQIKKIVSDLSDEFPCQRVDVIHRIGRVLVGETSIYVRVLAKHRFEAFNMCMGFMDRLKQDVPIWKIGSF